MTAELIEQLAALETRVALSLRDGTGHEGYILDTGPEHFELALGGPLAQDKPIVIAYENVELRSLSYLDGTERRYKDLV